MEEFSGFVLWSRHEIQSEIDFLHYHFKARSLLYGLWSFSMVVCSSLLDFCAKLSFSCENPSRHCQYPTSWRHAPQITAIQVCRNQDLLTSLQALSQALLVQPRSFARIFSSPSASPLNSVSRASITGLLSKAMCLEMILMITSRSPLSPSGVVLNA
jgi:hypothetical protein